jgi:hypothetical protein
MQLSCTSIIITVVDNVYAVHVQLTLDYNNHSQLVDPNTGGPMIDCMNE